MVTVSPAQGFSLIQQEAIQRCVMIHFVLILSGLQELDAGYRRSGGQGGRSSKQSPIFAQKALLRQGISKEKPNDQRQGAQGEAQQGTWRHSTERMMMDQRGRKEKDKI